MIYLLLFLEFLKIGLFTFGGGYAMIPLIRETVVARMWLTENEFYDFIGICESTPGPIAINMATYVEETKDDVAYGETLSENFDTIDEDNKLSKKDSKNLIIILIASILKHFTNNPIFKAFLNGVKPIIISLIISTGLIIFLKNIGYNSLSSFTFDFRSLIIFSLLVGTFLVIKFVFKKKLNTILLLLFSAILGIVVYTFIN